MTSGKSEYAIDYIIHFLKLNKKYLNKKLVTTTCKKHRAFGLNLKAWVSL